MAYYICIFVFVSGTFDFVEEFSIVKSKVVISEIHYLVLGKDELL